MRLFDRAHKKKKDGPGDENPRPSSGGREIREKKMNKIILTFKGRVVSETPFKGDAMTIGRGSGNDVEIDNPTISSSHARILREKDFFVIEDLGSTNGTYLNGKKITRSIINSTDDITIGKHHLKLAWKHGTGGHDPEGGNAPSATVVPSLDKTMMIDQKAQKQAPESGRQSIGGFAVMEGGVAKERIEMANRVTTIGKSADAIIRLKGLLAPKVGALVNRTDRGYVITAPDQKKPPVINGNPLDKPYTLKNGDIVEIGGLILRFYLKKG